MQKWQALINKTYLRIWRKVEISITTYDVWWMWKGTPYYGKGEEIIYDFNSRNSKILSVRFGIFKKFVWQRIERNEARVWLRDKLKDLESPEWGALNPKFSAQKAQKLTYFSKQQLFKPCFFMMQSVNRRFWEIPSRFFLIYIHLKPGIPCVLLQFIPKYSIKERNCLDNINFYTSHLSLKISRNLRI